MWCVLVFTRFNFTTVRARSCETNIHFLKYSRNIVSGYISGVWSSFDFETLFRKSIFWFFLNFSKSQKLIPFRNFFKSF